MGSLLQSTLNTRALPTGGMRYVRSDFPGKLSDEEVRWLRENNITTIVDLREESEFTGRPCRLETEKGFNYYHLPVTGVVSAIILKKLGYSDQVIIDDYMETKDNLLDFLTSYVREHPEVDLNVIIPKEENIRKVLEYINEK